MKPNKYLIYDNGGATFDRFTVVYLEFPESRGLYMARGMSERLTHPQGFGQITSAMPGRHLGRRIKLSALPVECQTVVKRDLGGLV